MLARLYGGGVAISERHKQATRLIELGRTVDETPGSSVKTDGRQHLWLFPEQAEKARNRKEDAQEKAASYYERIPAEWKKEWEGKEIHTEHWKPERVDKHDPEFRTFIRSHIPQFDRIKANMRFFLYIEQARRWLEEGASVEDFQGEEQVRYALKEMERIEQNRLYGMDKYGWIKDDEMPGGKRKYYASAPQALIIFCLDCGYSLEIGKGRQAAITSTVMLYEAFTMLVRTSYKGVLVTDDVEFTGKNIFNDKLKGSYQFVSRLNPWLKPPKIPNYAEKKIVFDWSESSTKDEAKAFSSEYSLAASDDTQTINGTTPSKVVLDEAQNIPTYTAIKLEARPTMLSSGEDGTIRIKRQIVAYGTGSSHQRGKGAFENEYKGTIRKWTESKDTSSFVPLFLDWTCRPNMTEKRYREEYDFYLNRNEDLAGMSKEERTAMFHAAMPSKPEDMFLTSHRTIIPPLILKRHQDRILDECHAKGLAPRPGRFEPIYNTAKAMPDGSYLPYYVTGAKWVESEPDDFEAPCLMLSDRAPGWIRRFVKGTDPIQSPTGNSKFASLILDRAGYIGELDGQRYFKPVVSCIVNWKNEVVEENFLQSALMGMYYANDKQRACMEVFEINQGQSYQRFLFSPFMDLGRSVYTRLAMPVRYRGGIQAGHPYGISIKSGRAGGTKGHLYADVRNGLLDMGDGIWHYEVFSQANNVVVEEKDGGMAYYPRNKNVDNDDLLDAFGFALIASEIEANDPLEIGVDAPRKVKKTVYDRDPMTLQLIEQEVEVDATY